MEWWRSLENVQELARWIDERGEFGSTSDVVYFFDKPWKWTAEYEAMRAQQRPEAA